jgi:hypothetical protein
MLNTACKTRSFQRKGLKGKTPLNFCLRQIPSEYKSDIFSSQRNFILIRFTYCAIRPTLPDMRTSPCCLLLTFNIVSSALRLSGPSKRRRS